MKKFLALAMAALCTASLLTSCAGNKGVNKEIVEQNPGLQVSEAAKKTIEKKLIIVYHVNIGMIKRKEVVSWIIMQLF